MSSGETNLNFDKADFGESVAGVECENCRSRITDRYYEINGRNHCQACHDRVAALSQTAGGARRFFLATVFGVGGGFLGAAVWYAVAKLFDMEIGLIAILVGWLVGRGVQMGNGGRGGLKYQILAAIVTYSSIVTTYIPPIYEGITSGSLKTSGKTEQGAITSATSTDSSVTVEADTPGKRHDPAATVAASVEPEETVEAVASATTPAPSADAPAGSPSDIPKSKPGLGAFLLAVAFLFGVAFVMPFWLGFSNLLGILIIGFAVHQAWTMNRRVVFDIKGPFRVSRHPAPAVTVTQANVDVPIE